MRYAGKIDDTAKYHGAPGWTFCQMLRATGNYADPAGPHAALRGAGSARRRARVLPHPRACRKLQRLLPELCMVALCGDLRPLTNLARHIQIAGCQQAFVNIVVQRP